MESLKRLAAITLLVPLAASFQAGGQTRTRPRSAGNPPAPKQTARPPVTFDVRPLDPNQERLPPNYQGHDIVTLYNRLEERKAKLKKGEYETTDDYQQRLRVEMAKPLTGELTVDALLAFKGKETEGITTAYDADKRALKVVASVGLPLEGAGIYNHQKREFIIRTVNGAKREYVGTNAFGVQARVTAITDDDYGITVTNYPEFVIKILSAEDLKFIESIEGDPSSTSMGTEAISAEIGMTVAEAMAAKSNLRLLFVCRLVPPYTTNGTFYRNPTLNSPTRLLIKLHYLNVRLEEVWFYDDASGRVYAKQKAKPIPITYDFIELEPVKEIPVEEGFDAPPPRRRAIPTGPSVTGGEILSKPLPPYPAAGRAARASGKVIVKVEIAENGDVDSVIAVSGHPLLRQVAVTAARQAKFSPASISGMAIRVSNTITYEFVCDAEFRKCEVK